jgi:hypothetical protein
LAHPTGALLTFGSTNQKGSVISVQLAKELKSCVFVCSMKSNVCFGSSYQKRCSLQLNQSEELNHYSTARPMGAVLSLHQLNIFVGHILKAT